MEVRGASADWYVISESETEGDHGVPSFQPAMAGNLKRKKVRQVQASPWGTRQGVAGVEHRSGVERSMCRHPEVVPPRVSVQKEDGSR